MKFKRYVKESTDVKTNSIKLEETLTESQDSSFVKGELEKIYKPVEDLIKDQKFSDALKEIESLERDLDEFEKDNSKKKFFKFPQVMIDAQREKLKQLKDQIPLTESIDDMHKRCEKCNTLLNDGGTCPKCDDGEEDYGDELKEELSNKEKLKRAYPELNFDVTEPVTEEIQTEELSVREKLLRAYPELNFDKPIAESIVTEELTNKEKLKRAFPELNFDTETTVEEGLINVTLDASLSDTEETVESLTEQDNEYDDNYDIEDDIEDDRMHAALYGGDRTYCDCGKKLVTTEWGSYCPDCDPKTAEEEHFNIVDDDIENEFLATMSEKDIRSKN